jgi:hypothetical protein
VLPADFGSGRLVALIAFTLPSALIGGVAAAFLSGGVLSLGSLVGFVTVLGIAARNGIMLVSHFGRVGLLGRGIPPLDQKRSRYQSPCRALPASGRPVQRRSVISLERRHDVRPGHERPS